MYDNVTEVSSVQFQRELGRWQDEALKRPVRITRHGRARLVLISVDEYERLARRDRIALRIEDVDEAHARIIAAARAPLETHEYDDEFEAPAKAG